MEANYFLTPQDLTKPFGANTEFPKEYRIGPCFIRPVLFMSESRSRVASGWCRSLGSGPIPFELPSIRKGSYPNLANLASRYFSRISLGLLLEQFGGLHWAPSWRFSPVLLGAVRISAVACCPAEFLPLQVCSIRRVRQWLRSSWLVRSWVALR